MEIEEGFLVCSRCGGNFEITEGIPRMLPHDLREPSSSKDFEHVEATLRTASGYDMHHLRGQAKHSPWERPPFGHGNNWDLARQYFRDYLALEADDLGRLQGRVVLDAGCGGGRFMAVAHENGAAEVIGLDLSMGGLLRARALLNRTGSFHLVQGDITRPPFRQGIFDVVYSIGVIHHLASPKAGLLALESLLCPGGSLWIWVYGLEGMSLAYQLSHLVWLRRFTRSWSLKAKFHLSRLLALAFGTYYLAPLRLLQGLLPSTIMGSLPFEGLTQWNYEDIVYAFFDRLQPPYTYYLRKADLQEWLTRLERVSIEAPNKRGWVAKGRRPEDEDYTRQ